MSSFWHFWPKKCKMTLFLHFVAQKWKNKLIFAFWLQKCEKRSPETLCLINLLSQAAKWTPKSDFGVPKRTFGHFWAQNRILASKIALLGPESHFGDHFGPWPKRFIKQRVSGTFFRTLGAKMQKWVHFALFGVPK